ncbi:MAG TPA: hypothetical protein VIG99_02940 [Myxococcaceae bacterium]|jgi:hypothetical protein
MRRKAAVVAAAIVGGLALGQGADVLVGTPFIAEGDPPYDNTFSSGPIRLAAPLVDAVWRLPPR